MTDIQVIQRVADILGAFSEDVSSVRLGPLAKELNVQRSTLHRYLNSMANAGMLGRAPDGAFTLGPLAQRIGALALEVGLGHEVLAQAVSELCAATRLTVVRSVWNELAPVVVQTQTPDTPTHVSVKVGTRLPITSAQMYVFLAFSGGEERTAPLMSLLPEIQRQELREEIELAAVQGIAIGGRVSSGVRAMAAPVLDAEGKTVMSLALIGTTTDVPDSPHSREARALIDTAAQLSTSLGFIGRHPGKSFLEEQALKAV
jgi:DNA-binding IclR family transcriptional regulator